MIESPRRAKVLLVDNRDSFVFNLVDDAARGGADCVTVRGDLDLSRLCEHLDSLDPDLVILSPGPGHPRDGGVMIPFLRTRPELPILGVCLGMQAMVCATGGTVERAPRPVHGRSALVDHDGDALFDGLPSPFPAARYHSLLATEIGCEWREIGSTSERGARLCMAIRHVELPWVGLQFHPESVLTPGGARLLTNLLTNPTSGTDR